MQPVDNNAQVLHRRALMALSSGKLMDGIHLLRQALTHSPRSSTIHNDLGAAYFQSGQGVLAEKHFAQAAASDPANLNALTNYVTILKKTGRLPLAEKNLLAALKIHPANAWVWAELGSAYANLQRPDEAVAHFRKSISLDPGVEKNWTYLLGYLESENLLTEFEELVPQARAAFPASPYIALQEAKLLRRQAKPQEALALLEKFQPQVSPDVPQSNNFFFELGQLYDRADDPDRAFPAYAQGNAVKARFSKLRRDDLDAITQFIARVKNDITAAMVEQPVPPPADGYPAPVFLIGFPRSGTTLLDQILSSCKGVTVAEEKGAVFRMIEVFEQALSGKPRAPYDDLAFFKSPRYPAGLEKLSGEDIAAMRRAFYAEHELHGDVKTARIFVDKLPLNMINAPLIQRVFPDAKFILALRHPCDSVLSCFMQNFAHNIYMARYFDLTDAARFYDEVFGQWEHFRKTFKMNVHEIRYEDVVADFKPTVARLLEFLGLPWDDAVLEFDKTARERNIRTPSYHQVTEKIYTRASGRWLRYKKHLQPILDILKPHAERHGYGMD